MKKATGVRIAAATVVAAAAVALPGCGGIFNALDVTGGAFVDAGKKAAPAKVSSNDAMASIAPAKTR